MGKKIIVFTYFMSILLISYSSAAFAQHLITVLGVKGSSIADTAQAQALTKALRRAVEEEGSFEHTGQTNDLDQLMLVFGCDEVTDECLRQIGQSLGGELILYGFLESHGQQKQIHLFLYDIQMGRNLPTEIEEPILSQVDSYEEFLPLARRFVARLSPSSQKGTLIIRCTVNESQVLLDGNSVGLIQNQTLILRNLNPGEHTIEIVRRGYQRVTRDIEIQSGQETTLNIEMAAEGEDTVPVVRTEDHVEIQTKAPTYSRRYLWLGLSLGSFAISLGMAGWGIYGIMGIDGINNDSDWQDARQQYSNSSDICAIPNLDSKIKDMCDDGEKFEIYQGLGFGIGAVLIGLGAYFLYLFYDYEDEPDSNTESSNVSISFSPVLSDSVQGVMFNFNY